MKEEFQKLVAYESLFSRIIDSLPYPLAIFTPRHTIVAANKIFLNLTESWDFVAKEQTLCIFQHKIDDIRLAEAIRKVFTGDIIFLEDLKNPFSMFSEKAQPALTTHNGLHRAVVFPIASCHATISHGVIVFMP